MSPKAKGEAAKAEADAAAETAKQMKVDQTVFLATMGAENATPDQQAAYEHYK